MGKKKVGVIFGGKSTENEVSKLSAKSVLSQIDKEKFEVYEIYIDKEGIWWETQEQKQVKKIENEMEYLKNMNVVFPVLHGLYGEDGTIQGLLEMLQIPYVGCGVLASSVGMDKVYTKVIFERAGLKLAKYVYIKKVNEEYVYVNKDFQEEKLTLQEIAKKTMNELKFPMFVKPSNSGSSVGINKARNEAELMEYIEYAGKFDSKILVEEGIVGREVECAVLGNNEVQASCVGEVKSAEEFYSYDAKYNNEESRTEIPAKISSELSDKIRRKYMDFGVMVD